MISLISRRHWSRSIQNLIVTIAMMKFLTLLVLLASSLCTKGQKAIHEMTVNLPPSKNFAAIGSYPDEAGYVLVHFQYTGQYHKFILIHREQGEVSQFEGQMAITTILGFTSNDQEFTLYMKGFYNSVKDYYFITFFKDPSRKPLITTWLDAIANDNQVLRYSANNKLYLYQNSKQGIERIEIETHGSFKKNLLMVEKDLKKNLDMPFTAEVTYPDSKFIYTTFDKSYSILPYQDSVIILKKKRGTIEEIGNSTSIIKIDFLKGNINSREVPAKNSNINALILKDRFFQLRLSGNGIGLGVYQYPSLQLLKEYDLQENDGIPFRNGSLLDEAGDTIDDKWEDDIKDRKTINKIKYGFPFLSAQETSGDYFLRLGSYVTTASTGSPSTGFSPGSSFTFYLNACVNKEGQPCGTTGKPVWDDIVQHNKQLNVDKKSDYFEVSSNSKYLYVIHFSNKSKNCLIEEYEL
jgi:hypothetical protein